MRRFCMLLVMLAISTASLGLVSVSPVSAASMPCTDTSGTPGTKMNDSDMHMDDSDMDMSSKSKRGTRAKNENCPTVAGAREIAVTGEAFAFDAQNLVLTAGEDVTIALTAGDITHDFYVKGIGHIVHAKAGKTAMGGLRIDEPGTYRYWCTVKGHKKAGMTGTITVT